VTRFLGMAKPFLQKRAKESPRFVRLSYQSGDNQIFDFTEENLKIKM